MYALLHRPYVEVGVFGVCWCVCMCVVVVCVGMFALPGEGVVDDDVCALTHTGIGSVSCRAMAKFDHFVCGLTRE